MTCVLTLGMLHSWVKLATASKTSAVFVISGTFEEPMEYPRGAK